VIITYAIDLVGSENVLYCLQADQGKSFWLLVLLVEADERSIVCAFATDGMLVLKSWKKLVKFEQLPTRSSLALWESSMTP
jgi:hypothetical protein